MYRQKLSRYLPESVADILQPLLFLARQERTRQASDTEARDCLCRPLMPPLGDS